MFRKPSAVAAVLAQQSEGYSTMISSPGLGSMAREWRAQPPGDPLHSTGPRACSLALTDAVTM